MGFTGSPSSSSGASNAGIPCGVEASTVDGLRLRVSCVDDVLKPIAESSGDMIEMLQSGFELLWV